MNRPAVPREIRELIRKMHHDLKKKMRASSKMILSESNSGRALMEKLSGLRSLQVSTFRIIYRIRGPEQVDLVAIGPRERI